MTDDGSSETRTKSPASRARDTLARLIPQLAFDEPLETQFRSWYAEHTRARIRNAMWIAMGNMLVVMLAGGPFRAMRDAIFGPGNELIVDVLRFGFIVPSSVAMLLVTYTHPCTGAGSVSLRRSSRRSRHVVRRHGHHDAPAGLLAQLVDAAGRARAVFRVRHAACSGGAHRGDDRGDVRHRRAHRWRRRSAALFRSVRHRFRGGHRRRRALFSAAKRAPQLSRDPGAERIREPRQPHRHPQPAHVR